MRLGYGSLEMPVVSSTERSCDIEKPCCVKQCGFFSTSIYGLRVIKQLYSECKGQKNLRGLAVSVVSVKLGCHKLVGSFKNSPKMPLLAVKKMSKTVKSRLDYYGYAQK